MALISAQLLSATAGTAATYGAVAASDTMVLEVGKRYVYHVINANASPDTVTVVVPGTDAFGQAKGDIAVTVTNATNKFIPLIFPDLLADGTTGLVTITHSVTSSVTAALLVLPNF